MKIVIKLKESSKVDLKKVLSNVDGITEVSFIVIDYYAACSIPQEDVKPGGKIDEILEALGGTNDVDFIRLDLC